VSESHHGHQVERAVCHVRAEAKGTVLINETVYSVSHPSWARRNNWALLTWDNIEQTDGTISVDKINVWFAVRIKSGQTNVPVK